MPFLLTHAAIRDKTATMLGGIFLSLLCAAPPAFLGFESIDPARETFCAVGDTQRTSNWEFWRERNFSQTQAIFKELAGRKPAFVLHLGDLTARGSSQKHWGYFDTWTEPLRNARVPMVPVLGNHEYYGRNTTALGNFFARFPFLKKRTYVSFTWRGITFLLLNSNFSELTTRRKEEQLRWYERELALAAKDPAVACVVICCHHPPYSNGTVVSPSKEVARCFAEPFRKLPKAGLFLSGHCHSYEHFLEGGKHFVVSGGGGGPRHDLCVDPARQHPKDLFNGPEKRFFHFLEVRPAGGGLQVKVAALTEKGSFAVADSFSVP